MSVEGSNKAAKRSYFDAYRARDLTIFDRLFHPDYVIRAAGFEEIRRDELSSLVSGSFDTLSDIELDLDDMVAEGDRVVTRYTFRARHTGNFHGCSGQSPFDLMVGNRDRSICRRSHHRSVGDFRQIWPDGAARSA